MFRNGETGIGNGDVEQLFTTKTVVQENYPAFPVEIPVVLPFFACFDHIRVVRHFFTYQYLRPHTVSVERVH